MNETLSGKVALVTGGSSGIGAAIAGRFAAEGATVFITGRRQEAIDDAVAEIDGNVVGVRADASSKADLDALFAEIGERAGRIDVLVANAGGGLFAPLGEITEEQYHDTFDVNVKGTIFTVQGALPLLPDGASVILMGSNASASAPPRRSASTRPPNRGPKPRSRLGARPQGPRDPRQRPLARTDPHPGSRRPGSRRCSSRAPSTPSPPRSPWAASPTPPRSPPPPSSSPPRTRASSTASSSSPTGDRLRSREDGRGPRRVEAPGGQAAAGIASSIRMAAIAAAVSNVSAFRTRLRAEAPSRSSASCSPSASGSVAPASRAASVSRAAKAFL